MRGNMITKLKTIVEGFRHDTDTEPDNVEVIRASFPESNAVKSARQAQEAIGASTFVDGTKRDIELVASHGHVLAVQLTNDIRRRAFFAPVKALAIVCLASTAVVMLPNLAEQASGSAERSDGGWLREMIAFDPSSAITLPDGTAAHARFAKLLHLPPARTGMPDIAAFSESFSTNLDAIRDLQNAQVRSSRAVEEVASAENERGLMDTRVWNAWADLQSAFRGPAVSGMPIFPAAGFWRNEKALEAMASSGVVAYQADSLLAAAYVNGVPSLNVVADGGCFNLVGAKLDSACKRLSGDQPLPAIVNATFEEPSSAAQPDAKSAIPARWYLDLPGLQSEGSVSAASLEAAASIQKENADAGGVSWSSDIWNAVGSDTSPLITRAEGFWNNEAAINAMISRPIIAMTKNVDEFIVAGNHDGRALVQLFAQERCVTIFGVETRQCQYGDVSASEALLKSMYSGAPASALEPVTFYAGIPFQGTGTNPNGYLALFTAVLNDLSRYGGTRDDVGKWTESKKLKSQAQILRPDAFFASEANVASLSKGGAVIIPRDRENTVILAAYVDGTLVMDVAEVGRDGRRVKCTSIFGRSPILECGSSDLSQHRAMLTELFKEN